MRIFDYFKKGKKEEVEPEKITPEVKINKGLVKTRHENRINNLGGEFESLSNELKGIEEDLEMHKGQKAKTSDAIISRLSHIKYEIEIRKDLISWL